MLKEEVGESLKRLKAAKYGHKISLIVPQHQNSFYLPEKEKYRVVTPKIRDLRYKLKSPDSKSDHPNLQSPTINSQGETSQFPDLTNS